jgi:hypothetical protein
VQVRAAAVTSIGSGRMSLANQEGASIASVPEKMEVL